MTMRGAFRLFMVVGEAALMAGAGIFALILITVRLLPPTPSAPTGVQTIAAMFAVFLPSGLATWWVFRQLQPHFPRREARAVAIAFVVFAPVSFAIANLLYAIPGSIAGPLLSKSRLGFLSALLVGIAIMTALLASLGCALALWITRRIERAEQHNLPKPSSSEF